MKKYVITAQLSATRALDGGLLYMLGGHVLKLARLIILLLLWKSLADGGADLRGMTIDQLLTYTLISSVLTEQLNVITPATTAFWEGSIVSRYMRPAPVLSQMVSETVGGWIPGMLLYSLPMLVVVAPFIGANPFVAYAPNALPFMVSLLFSISLGFAMDFLFASLVIYIKNASYTAYSIRQAITKFFSGALIPFALLPWGIGGLLELLPFGSVASAPLLIFVGSDRVWGLLGLQLFWNLVMWPVALWSFRRSEERMVSYGG